MQKNRELSEAQIDVDTAQVEEQIVRAKEKAAKLRDGLISIPSVSDKEWVEEDISSDQPKTEEEE